MEALERSYVSVDKADVRVLDLLSLADVPETPVSNLVFKLDIGSFGDTAEGWSEALVSLMALSN